MRRLHFPGLSAAALLLAAAPGPAAKPIEVLAADPRPTKRIRRVITGSGSKHYSAGGGARERARRLAQLEKGKT